MKVTTRRRSLAALVISACAAFAVWAADGDLDFNFTGDGSERFDLTGNSSFQLNNLDILDKAVAFNGKVIAAGSPEDDSETVVNPPVFLTRFNDSGNFNTDYRLVIGLAGTSNLLHGAGDIAISPVDGKVFVVGGRQNAGGFFEVMAKAFVVNQSGQNFTAAEAGAFVLGGGTATSQSFCDSAILDSAGRLVMACVMDFNESNRADLRAALVRLTVGSNSLTLDNSFGVNGVARFPTQPAGGCSEEFYPSLVRQETNGNYVLAATCYFDTSPEQSDVYVLRFSSNGTPTTSGFGTNGLLRVAIPGELSPDVDAGLIDSSGRFLVGGEDFHENDGNASQVFIARINLTTGALDSTFGASGVFRETNNDFGFTVEALVELPGGKLLANGGNSIFRLNSNGTDDTGFVKQRTFNIFPGFKGVDFTDIVLTDGGTRAMVVGGVSEFCVRNPNNCGSGVQLTEAIAAKIRLVSDTTPDSYLFNAQTGVTPGSFATSNPITVSGIDSPASISVAGDGNSQYSIGCNGSFTNITGTITNGQTVCVRHTAASTPNTTRSTVLSIGGVQGTFTATTADVDTTPNDFSFNAQTNVALGETRTSNTVTITGIDSPATISIVGTSGTNARYDIDCDGGPVSNTGTISNNQQVCVLVTAASTPQTLQAASLNVGGVSRDFNVTTGDAAILARSPTSLTFASRPQGSTSPAQTVTVTNNGTSVMNSFNITTSGDYAQTNTCSSVAAGGNCTVSVTFTPTATGTRTGTLTINSNAFNSPVTVSLTGTATGPAPVISFNPTSLTFATFQVGQSSMPAPVTLTNTGTTTLTISSIGSSNAAEFPITNNCPTGTPIAIGGSCTFNVTFSPSAAGFRSGSIVVTSNTTNGTDSFAVDGTGTAPIAGLSVNSVAFGQQRVGTTSGTMSVTLSNTGTAPLTFSSIAVGGTHAGDFTKASDACVSPLAAGSNCNVTLTFTPSATGTRSGSLTVTSNGGNPSATLSGTGTASSIAATPSPLAFGNVGTGSNSTLQLTVNNSGTAPLNISARNLGGTNAADFSINSGCTTAVAAGGSCTIGVTFTPGAQAARSGTLTLVSDALGQSPLVVNLSGTGVQPGISLSPSPLNFGDRRVGVANTQAVTVTNSGTSALTVSGVTITGTNAANFTQTNTCSSALAPAATCSINVTFNASALGARTATLNVASNAPGSPNTLTLNGTGVAPVAGVSPTSLSFGNVFTGETPTQVVTISNTGTATLAITNIAITGTGYSRTSNCSNTLVASGTCTVTVQFAPTQVGASNGTLTVTTDDGAPRTVSLSGTGVAAGINASTAGLSFAAQRTGTTSAAQQVSFTNTGTGNLTVNAPTLTGTNANNFAISANTCTTAVAPSQSCSISVTFTPSATGSRVGTLNVGSNAGARTVNLSGTGTAPVLGAANPTTLDFGNQGQGSTGDVKSFTFANTGSAAMLVNSITLTGTNAGDFALTSATPCGTSIAAGASCTVSLRFSPTATGTRSASVSLDTDAGTGSVAVSGNGLSAATARGTNVATTNGTLSSLSGAAAGPAGAILPSGYSVSSAGYFSFRITLAGGATSTNVIFTLPAGTSADSYLKCPAAGGTCTVVPGTTRVGDRLTVTLRDNVAGEDSNPAVGIIDDPGAPAIGPAPAGGGGGSLGWATLLVGLPILLRRRRLH